MTCSSTNGPELAKAAARFIGVRFQLLGRDPLLGLDCVGLVTCSLEAIGRHPVVPAGYRLRNSDHIP
ncbi:MAG: peptidoglycan endopeptidase, partial [Pseudomonadota bacterium]